MDKSREQFEEWAKDKYILEVSKYGGYRAVSTKNAFDAWQASRAALLIQLPKVPKLDFGDEFTNGAECGKEIMLDDVTDILKQAGIKCS
jgi:hypothetical protein